MCYGLKVGKRFYPFLLANNALLAAGVACKALLSNLYPSQDGSLDRQGSQKEPPYLPSRGSLMQYDLLLKLMLFIMISL